MNLSEFQHDLDRHCDDVSSPERDAWITMRSLLRMSYSLEKAEKDLTCMILGQQQKLARMGRVLKDLQTLGIDVSQFYNKLRNQCDRAYVGGTYLEIWSKLSPSFPQSEAIAIVTSMIETQKCYLVTMRNTLKALKKGNHHA